MVPKNCNIALIYPKKIVPKKARSEIFLKKKKKKNENERNSCCWGNEINKLKDQQINKYIKEESHIEKINYRRKNKNNFNKYGRK